MSCNSLNTPCTDPLGQVYECDGLFYRGIYKNKEEFTKNIVTSDWFKQLVEKDYFVNTWVSVKEIPGFDLVMACESSPFSIPIHRYARNTLAQCAITWLSINDILLKNGYFLGDCHYGNFMLFDANRPKFIDLGSIHHVKEAGEYRGFPCYKEFISETLVPLLILYKNDKYTRIARDVILDSVINGPLCSEGEIQADLSFMVNDYIEDVIENIGSIDGAQVIPFLVSYIDDMRRLDSCSGLEKIVIDGVVESFGRVGCKIKNIVCFGVDLFWSINSFFSGVYISVIDDVRSRADGLSLWLEDNGSKNIVAIQLENVINREFFGRLSSSQIVICHLPFERYRHNSCVMYENIASVIFAAGRAAIVSIKTSDKKGVTAMVTLYKSVVVVYRCDEYSWFICANQSLVNQDCGVFK